MSLNARGCVGKNLLRWMAEFEQNDSIIGESKHEEPITVPNSIGTCYKRRRNFIQANTPRSFLTNLYQNGDEDARSSNQQLKNTGVQGGNWEVQKNGNFETSKLSRELHEHAGKY